MFLHKAFWNNLDSHLSTDTYIHTSVDDISFICSTVGKLERAKSFRRERLAPMEQECLCSEDVSDHQWTVIQDCYEAAQLGV